LTERRYRCDCKTTMALGDLGVLGLNP
jgi:hypothetical protein